MKFKKLGFIIFFILAIIFFKDFFFRGNIPIPADTIVGLYHPFRDLYAQEYPRGIPFKNFLITDPVRQQYPWRHLAVEVEKKLQLPLWNPYNFAGTPLLANFQSATLYPLNILFFILPFNYGWTALIILQPILGGIFMYMYLRFIKLEKAAALLGGIIFAFSGSSIAWMQWNTIFHTILWLPLILLAKEHILHKKSYKWMAVLVFAEVSAILAGHLQTLFYTLLISNIYLVFRIWQLNKDKNIRAILNTCKKFLLIGIVVLSLSAIQWWPTLQFILLSARDVDQISLKEGWFIPIQHLIQFIAPDFFGNPATLNYWGVWNYAEFIGYISIFPLILMLYLLLYRKDKKVLFFGAILVTSLVFSTDNPIARIPFLLNIPFVSTSQPTRLIFIADFALAILAALGLDYFLKAKKSIVVPLLVVFGVFISLWVIVVLNQFSIPTDSLAVAKRNLLLPTAIFIASSILVLLKMYIKNVLFSRLVIVLLISMVTYDLFRMGDKFLPFVESKYIFPQTKTIEFLQENAGNHRIMSLDNRILPPNFSIMYKIQTVEGYDPLYLRSYGELIAASERGKPDISPPFGFNRIITPKNYDSKIIDLLGVKYVLSLSDITSPKLKKVFQDGETRVYENIEVFPRAFIIDYSLPANNKEDVINAMFDTEYYDLKKVGFIEDKNFSGNPKDTIFKIRTPLRASADIIEYSENKVIISVESNQVAELVLTDSYYPTWKATIDGKDAEINRINYNFRSISIPSGKHTIKFYNSLF